MDVSIFLATLLGPLFVVVSLGLFLNAKYYERMISHFLKNPELYYFSGVLAFVGGVTMVYFHNLWVYDWRVVITLLAWLTLMKGVLRILCPETGLRAAKVFTEDRGVLNGGSSVLFLIGAFLMFMAFAG